MKEQKDFKMLRKGNKVRKYYHEENQGDYIVLRGGRNDGFTIAYCEHIFSHVPEWIHIDNLVKLADKE